MHISYFSLIVISLLLGLGTQAYIRMTYNRWSKVPLGNGMSGRQMSRQMLDEAGLQDVPIQNKGGADLSDYYDPRSNALYLSGGSDSGASVASAAVACHEAGHAVQHARGYMPARLRMTLVPIVNFGEQAWMIVLLLGIVMNVTGLINLGIFLFAFVVLFEIVTLPVEFDASRRATAYIKSVPGVSATEAAGARQVLVAAALTYVAAALSSILQLLYLLGQRRD
ncbi:MAG: zinc metallopeptidase [Coriobacteriales bacterium]|jgi:Zn-dependent membrane protease YugP